MIIDTLTTLVFAWQEWAEVREGWDVPCEDKFAGAYSPNERRDRDQLAQHNCGRFRGS